MSLAFLTALGAIAARVGGAPVAAGGLARDVLGGLNGVIIGSVAAAMFVATWALLSQKGAAG